MGLFDRLFSSSSGANSAPEAKPKPRKQTEAVFLDADSASSLGDVNLMKRSNRIRHTFPGTAASPGTKEMVAEVSSMETKVEKMSEGLPGAARAEADINLTGGVPKPVKKTFVQQMSPAQLEQRRKGAAVAVNTPGGPAALKKEAQQAPSAPAAQPLISQQAPSKPGAIDPFRQMVRELNS